MSLLARVLATRDGAAGLALLATMTFFALAAPLIFPGDPLAIVAPPLMPPFADPAHLLGSDRLGRDVLAGLAHGSRTSLFVALAAMAGAILVGTLIGTAAGFAGGLVDEALMRLAEAFQTVPAFLLALAMISVLGPNMPAIIAAIAAGAWPQPARIVRAEVLSLRERDFVAAARVLGMGPVRIALGEILPNALRPVITLAAIIAAAAILIEAALSFLGFGDPNRVSWGSMIAEGRAVLRSAPWLSIVPGMALVVTVLAIHLLGRGLAAALQPRRIEP